MTARQPLEQCLTAAWPAATWQDVTVLVAVSGGADSVALARALRQLKQAGAGRLAIGHFNHRLRGEASDQDQAFVDRLAGCLGLEVRIGQAGGVAQPAGDGMEAAARTERYAFLQQVAEDLGARYVVTAHTADDQAETVLHHVLRGTGLAGLAGISRCCALGPATTLVRPLLDVRRAQVLEYLAAIDQPFREDASNISREFTRNRIRHELLPLIQRDYSPGVAESLVRLAAVAADAQRVLETLAGDLLERAIIEREACRVTLSVGPLAGQPRHLIREAFVALWRLQNWPQQAMGYTQWNLLADMVASPAVRGETSQQMLPGAVAAQRHGEQLVLARL